jgi:glutamine phosphoribosylpyrophosphate amidotransferase
VKIAPVDNFNKKQPFGCLSHKFKNMTEIKISLGGKLVNLAELYKKLESELNKFSGYTDMDTGISISVSLVNPLKQPLQQDVVY